LIKRLNSNLLTFIYVAVRKKIWYLTKGQISKMHTSYTPAIYWGSWNYVQHPSIFTCWIYQNDRKLATT